VPILKASARVAGFAQKGTSPLSNPVLSQASATRPEPVSRRPVAPETLKLVLAQLDDAKAEDTVTIDLNGKTAIADFMVVTSGRSNRQVGAIADRLLKAFGEAGIKGVRVEGMPHCDWVLIDASDVIVHVFRPEVRAFYNLEKMWAAGLSPERRVS
jgi:ribosome-associated protein